MEDADAAPVAVESEDVKKEMDKLCFPQLEGDMAPGALIPKACASLQKQITKLQHMLEPCKSVERLTPLQKRILVMYDHGRGKPVLPRMHYTNQSKHIT